MDTALIVFLKDGMIMLCYADDSFLISNQKRSADDIQCRFNSRFYLENLDKLKDFFALNVIRYFDRSLLFGIEIFLNKLLQETVMDKDKPAGSPLHLSWFANNAETKLLGTMSNWHAMDHNIIGNLMSLAVRTRLDVRLAASILAWLLNKAASALPAEVQQALYYPKGVRIKEMMMKHDESDRLTA